MAVFRFRNRNIDLTLKNGVQFYAPYTKCIWYFRLNDAFCYYNIHVICDFWWTFDLLVLSSKSRDRGQVYWPVYVLIFRQTQTHTSFGQSLFFIRYSQISNSILSWPDTDRGRCPYQSRKWIVKNLDGGQGLRQGFGQTCLAKTDSQFRNINLNFTVP